MVGKILLVVSLWTILGIAIIYLTYKRSERKDARRHELRKLREKRDYDVLMGEVEKDELDRELEK